MDLARLPCLGHDHLDSPQRDRFHFQFVWVISLAYSVTLKKQGDPCVVINFEVHISRGDLHDAIGYPPLISFDCSGG